MKICKECKQGGGIHNAFCQSMSEDLKRQEYQRYEKQLNKRREFDRAILKAIRLGYINPINYIK